VTRQEKYELIGTFSLVALAAACKYAELGEVVTFAACAVALAALARLVGNATRELGARLGSGGASVVQSGLGNLPELFIAVFALREGLVGVVQAALVGSILANSILVLGLAFVVGGIANGPQRFDSSRARMVSTLTLLAAATMAMPSLAHAFHTPAAAHGHALSLVCAGVLLAVFMLTLPSFLRSAEGDEHEPARWSPALTFAVLTVAGVAAAFASDWFVDALRPAIHTLHMSEDFAGLVIVAIAGNAVENVAGVALAAKGRSDLAIAVIKNSVAQIAAFLYPVLVLVSLLTATTLTFTLAPVYVGALIGTAIIVWQITGDGEATVFEGVALVATFVILATVAAFE
jgi:Ca2+:H+ antiporter